MTKLDKLVSNSIFKVLVPVSGLLIMAFGGALFAQTIDLIKDNKIAHEKLCDKTEKSLHEKVDVVDLDRTLKYMEKNSDRQWATMQKLMERSEKIEIKVDVIQRDITDIKRKLP